MTLEQDITAVLEHYLEKIEHIDTLLYRLERMK